MPAATQQEDYGWSSRVIDLADQFRIIHPDATLNQLIVFLLVAGAGPDGANLKDIMTRTGLSDSAASRITQVLSERGNRGDPRVRLGDHQV